MSLPTLTGREYEITEATITRNEMLTHLADEITAMAGNAPAELTASLVALYREVALRQTDADWWIQHMHHKLGPTVQKLFTAEDKSRLAELAAKR